MKHRISVKEDKQGYFTIYLDSRLLAYGMTKTQADFFYRGVAHGISVTGKKVEMDDSIYETFC